MSIDKELREAIKSGDVDLVDKAIKGLWGRETNIDDCDKNGWTALHIGVNEDQPDIVKLLLDRGADPYLFTNRMRGYLAPIHLSVSEESDPCLRHFLDSGQDINFKTGGPYGQTPIQMIMKSYGPRRQSTATIIMTLLDHGADRSYVTENGGETLLHVAAGSCEYDNDLLLRVLADGEHDVNGKDKSGSSPLHQCRNYSAVKLLVTHGADVGVTNDIGNTPLHSRCVYPEILKALLDCGAGINARNHEGNTALIVAYSCGEGLESVQVLLERGADANLQNKVGRTIMHGIAVSGKSRALVKLLAYGGSTHVPDNEDVTPMNLMLWRRDKRLHGKCLRDILVESDVRTMLHSAALGGSIEKINSGIGNGENLEALAGGWTPLHWAAGSGHAECAQALLAAGAEPDPVDPGGRTPLYNAVRQGELNCVQVLLGAGASAVSAQNALLGLYNHATLRNSRNIIGDGRRQILQLMLDNGLSVDAADGHGNTFLHRMSRLVVPAGDMNALLAAGPDLNAINDDGDTPLIVYLRDNPRPSLVGLKALLDAGADQNIAWPDGGDPVTCINERMHGKQHHDEYFISSQIGNSMIDILDQYGLDTESMGIDAAETSRSAVSGADAERPGVGAV